MSRRKRGGKNRKRTRKGAAQSRKLELKTEGQVYAEAVQLLGDARVKCFCYDGKERCCKICGKMRRRDFVNRGDVVVVALRLGLDQDDKGDVIYKYLQDEVRRLRQMEELPSDDEVYRMKNPSAETHDDAGATQIVFDDV